MRSYGFPELMRVYRRVKRFFVLILLVLLLAGIGSVLKNIVLNQIKSQIQDSFGYTRLYLNLFPPSLVLEDARSVSVSPFFSAKKVAVGISYRQLFSREKPFNVMVENPVLRIYRAPDAEEEPKDIRTLFPFAIDRVLVRNGELYYWGQETRVQSRGINARLTQSGNRYALNAEANDFELVMGQFPDSIEGRLGISLEGEGDSIRIKRARISTPKGLVRAEGTVANLSDPEIEINSSYNVRVGFIADMLNLPFEYEGQVRGKGVFSRTNREIGFSGSLSSTDFVLNKIEMDRVNGRLEFKAQTGGTLNLSIRRRDYAPESLRIRFQGNRIDGNARGIHLDPVMRYIEVPWPLSSPAWGTFSVNRGQLTADIDFRDDLEDPGGEPFRVKGNVKLTLFDNEVSISSEDLDSNFCRVSAGGRIAIDSDVDVSIEGDVKDVKTTREFVALILQKNFDFPEIRGTGQAKVRIFGDFAEPQVEATFAASPGGFDNFDVESANGEFEIVEGTFYGRIRVLDPIARGRINVVSNIDETRVEIRLEEGLSEAILPKLDILLPLEGFASGYFEVKQQGEAIHVTGDFKSPQMYFLKQSATQVRGTFEWEEDYLFFRELQFNMYEGQVSGTALLRLLSEKFDLDMRGENIDFSTIFPQLQGVLSFHLKGGGDFANDAAVGPFAVKDILLEPFQKTESEGEAELTFTQERLDLRLEGNFLPGENRYSVWLGIPFFEDTLEGKINGSFTNPDLLLQWTGAKGEVRYLADLNGLKTAPKIRGAIDIRGSVLPFPQFAHAVRDFSGLLFFKNGDFSIRSFQGKFAGGDVQGSGRVKIGFQGIEEIDAKAEGENLLLAVVERTRALADGTIHLVKDADRFELIGDFFAYQALWQREIDEKLAFSSRSLYTPRREPNFFDDLNLNIRLRADDNVWIENSLGRMRGKVDLSISGNMLVPIITGDIEIVGGEVLFQDREFKVLSGKVSFINPAKIEPYITFRGETFVKDYRVTFSLDGFMESLNPELSSSPPLPPEDVLALLAMGESFRRTYQYDRSTQIGTASLLSFQLSEQAKKSAEGLFSIDRFRIDPFMMGASSAVTARLTMGKKISRDFFILYSTNLSAQREDIIRLEWEFTNDMSIVATRDEEGRVALDVKIHKRF